MPRCDAPPSLPQGRPFYAVLEGGEPVIAWIWPGPDAHWTQWPPCIRDSVGMDAHHVFPQFFSGWRGPTTPATPGCAVVWSPEREFPFLVQPAEVAQVLVLG